MGKHRCIKESEKLQALLRGDPSGLKVKTPIFLLLTIFTFGVVFHASGGDALAIEEFASFTAEKITVVDRRRANRDRLNFRGTFVLGPDSNGINPVSESVEVIVRGVEDKIVFSDLIPPGSFKEINSGFLSIFFRGNKGALKKYVFLSRENGRIRFISIAENRDGSYDFQIRGNRLNFSCCLNTTVTLIIGDDGGTIDADTKNQIPMLNGRENFFACNMVAADNALQAELAANPTDQEAHFFRALTRLFRMVEETENGPDQSVFTDSLKEILDQFGFTSDGRSICRFTSHPPKNANEEVTLPQDSPNGEEIQSWWENVALPAVMASIQDNLQNIDSSFNLVLTQDELSAFGLMNTGPVEIDYGEVKLLESALFLIKVLLEFFLAYDVNFDIDETVNKGNTLNVQQDVIDANLSFATLRPGKMGFLPQARTSFISAIDAFHAATDFIRAEADAQDDDFISIEADDLFIVDDMDFGLGEFRAALAGGGQLGTTPVNFGQVFDNPADLRGLLPPIPTNPGGSNVLTILSILTNDLPDPTFNNAFPTTDVNDLKKFLESNKTGIPFVLERWGLSD